MKNLPLFLILMLMPVIMVFSSEKAHADIFYHYFTVEFKEGTSDKFIRLVSMMTDAEVHEKSKDGKYKFRIPNDNGNRNALNRYTELFSSFPYVENVNTENEQPWTNLKPGQVIPGILLVKFKQEATNKQIRDFNKSNKVIAELYIPALNLYKIKLPSSLSIEKALEIYTVSPLVEYAEPDRVMSIHEAITDAEKKDRFVTIIFKSIDEDLVMSLFNLVFNTDFHEKKGYNGYVLKLPENMSNETALRTLDLCPYVMNIDLVKR